MSANPTTPPTTPPAIAGTFFLALGIADALDEALLVGIGNLVDSGPPVVYASQNPSTVFTDKIYQLLGWQ